MKYLNWHLSKVRDPLMLNATHEDRGIWFMLMNYCHEAENSGIINGCSEWSDNVWMSVAQTTIARLRQKSSLWQWSGLSLVVNLYDVEAEAWEKKKSVDGKIFAQKRWADERQRKNERASKKVTKFPRPKEENG